MNDTPVDYAIEFSNQGAPAVRMAIADRRLTIGSSPFNTLSLPTPDIARRQCELVRSEAAIALIDLSGRGTIVNGKRQSECSLAMGDRLELGSITAKLIRIQPEEGVAGGNNQQKTVRLDEPGQTGACGTLKWREGKSEKKISISHQIIIGSDVETEVQLEDTFISRRHCMLQPTEDGVLLRDLNSTNGTWLGDIRVFEVILPAKAEIKIGESLLSYRGQSPGDSPVADSFFGMIGKHPDFLSAQALMRRMAPQEKTLLIYGESGTGKELAARAIHKLSPRGEGPFVAINCGALVAELVESELFGHVKGAFSGATTNRIGAFEAARGGTLFLDEIGELPLSLQPKLLRALEGQEIRAVGCDKVIQHDARVIVATNRDLAVMVNQKEFRQDLFFRIGGLAIRLPALRERRADIPFLARHFIREAGHSVRLAGDAEEALCSYFWPGNIRELQSVVTTSLIYFPEAIEAGELREEFLVLNGPGALLGMGATGTGPGGYCGQTIQDMEIELIREALQYHNGNRRKTYQALGISKSKLYEKIKKYNLDEKD